MDDDVPRRIDGRRKHERPDLEAIARINPNLAPPIDAAVALSLPSDEPSDSRKTEDEPDDERPRR